MIYDGDILGVEIVQTLHGGWVAVVIDNMARRHYADIKGVIPYHPGDEFPRYDVDHLADALRAGLGLPFKPQIQDPTPALDDQILVPDTGDWPLREILPDEVLADALGHLIDAVDMIQYHAGRGNVPMPPHDQGEVADYLNKAGRDLRQFRDARRAEAR